MLMKWASVEGGRTPRRWICADDAYGLYDFRLS